VFAEDVSAARGRGVVSELCHPSLASSALHLVPPPKWHRRVCSECSKVCVTMCVSSRLIEL
jgi:hypothetical protein